MAGESTSKWMIIGTWVIAISTLVSVFITSNKMEQQVDELKKSNDLEWRPKLYVDHLKESYNFWYILMDKNKVDTITIAFDSMNINKSEFLNVEYLSAKFLRDVKLKNKGKLPLFVKSIVSSTITDYEWEQNYYKDPKRLVQHLIRSIEKNTIDRDFIIEPDSFKVLNGLGYGRTIPKDKFLSRLKSKDSFIFYTYTYVQYEDVFENKYDCIYMLAGTFNFDIIGDYIHVSDTIRNVYLEKFQWDVYFK